MSGLQSERTARLADSGLLQAMASNRSLFNQTLGYGAQGELHQDESIKWSYTGYSLSNYVFDIQFGSTDEAAIQAKIEAVLSIFQQKHASTTWIIDPFCTPKTLTTVLDHYARSSKGQFRAMALRMSDFAENAEVTSAIVVEEATSQSQLEVWGKILSEGFGISGAQSEEYQRLCINAALAVGPHFSFRHFVGFRQGKPVSATSLLLDGTMAGIYWVTTVPEVRRQKAAVTTLRHALTLAKKLGYEWSVLQATPMGVGLYTRLGFREYYQETYYDGLLLER